MKWIKWLIPIMAISLVVTCVCVNKHKKDWENDFAPYSIRMLLPETNYVEQPAYNMIGEEGIISYSENGLSYTKNTGLISKELMEELIPKADIPR